MSSTSSATSTPTAQSDPDVEKGFIGKGCDTLKDKCCPKDWGTTIFKAACLASCFIPGAALLIPGIIGLSNCEYGEHDYEVCVETNQKLLLIGSIFLCSFCCCLSCCTPLGDHLAAAGRSYNTFHMMTGRWPGDPLHH